MKLHIDVEFSQDELDKMVVQEVLDKQSEAMTAAADKIVEAKLQYFTDKLAAEVTAAHRKTQTEQELQKKQPLAWLPDAP